MFHRFRTTAEEREQGFTLIELLVVIIIIGILAAIAIPVFLNQRQKGVDAQLKANVKNAANAAEAFSVAAPTATSFDSVQMVANGFKKTPGQYVLISGGPATGYCVKSFESFGDDEFFYDSLAGGLRTAKGVVPTGGVCATASTWVSLTN